MADEKAKHCNLIENLHPSENEFVIRRQKTNPHDITNSFVQVCFCFWVDWAILDSTENSEILLKYSDLWKNVNFGLKDSFLSQSIIKHTHSILYARALCIFFIQLGMYDFEKNTKPKSIKRALSWFFPLLKWKAKIPTLCSFCKIKDCLKWLMVFWSIINTECMISLSDF